MRNLLRAIALSAVAAVAWTGGAPAASVFCPDTPSTTDTELKLTTSTPAACIGFGDGNISGNPKTENPDPIFNLALAPVGLVLIDKSDGSGGAIDGALTGTPAGLASGLSGTFSFSAPGFTDFVLAFIEWAREEQPELVGIPAAGRRDQRRLGDLGEERPVAR